MGNSAGRPRDAAWESVPAYDAAANDVENSPVPSEETKKPLPLSSTASATVFAADEFPEAVKPTTVAMPEKEPASSPSGLWSHRVLRRKARLGLVGIIVALLLLGLRLLGMLPFCWGPPHHPPMPALVLVAEDSPRAAVFANAEGLGAGETVPLTLSSHPGLSLVPRGRPLPPFVLGEDVWSVVELGWAPEPHHPHGDEDEAFEGRKHMMDAPEPEDPELDEPEREEGPIARWVQELRRHGEEGGRGRGRGHHGRGHHHHGCPHGRHGPLEGRLVEGFLEFPELEERVLDVAWWDLRLENVVNGIRSHNAHPERTFIDDGAGGGGRKWKLRADGKIEAAGAPGLVLGVGMPRVVLVPRDSPLQLEFENVDALVAGEEAALTLYGRYYDLAVIGQQEKPLKAEVGGTEWSYIELGIGGADDAVSMAAREGFLMRAPTPSDPEEAVLDISMWKVAPGTPLNLVAGPTSEQTWMRSPGRDFRISEEGRTIVANADQHLVLGMSFPPHPPHESE